MSRRSLVLGLALLPLTTVGAVIYSLPVQWQDPAPPQEQIAPQGERLHSEPGRSALEAEATPQVRPAPARESNDSEKNPQDRDSTRTAPSRPNAGEVTGRPMLASVAPALATARPLSSAAVTRRC